MIQYYFKSLKNKQLQEIEEPRAGALIVATNINQEETNHLISLGFDEFLLEDANDYFEVPRFEYEDDIHYLFTRYVVSTPAVELSTAPLLMAISNEYVLFVSHKVPDVLEPYLANQRKESLITTQKVKLVITLVEDMAKRYERSIMSIRRTMLKHFKTVENIDENDIKEFVNLESTLADYLSALVPMQTALTLMLKGKHSLELHEDDIDLVEDLIQDVNQLKDSASGISKTMQSIRSAHSSIVANKLNTTMKTLTAVTILLTIPTIIASLFGMNTWLPLSDGPVSFVLVLVLIIAMSLLVGRFFAKSKWI